MMTARAALDALIRPHLPAGIDLVTYSRDLGTVTRSTVMLRLDRVTPGPASGFRNYSFALVLVAAKTAPGPGDDELEALLEDVLFIVENKLGEVAVTWTEAQRGVFPPDTQAYPAFELPVTATLSIQE